LEPKQFFDANVYCDKAVCNTSHWQSLDEVSIDESAVQAVKTNTSLYYLAFDSGVVDKVATEENWAYGSIIVNHIGTDATTGTWRYDTDYQGDAEYSFMLFLNSTSGDVANYWGAYIQELILRDFLSTAAGDDRTV